MINPIRLTGLFPDHAAQARTATDTSNGASALMAMDALRDLPPHMAFAVIREYAEGLPGDALCELERAREFFNEMAWERGRDDQT